MWHKEASDRFEVGENYLQFEYAEDHIRVIVAAIGDGDHTGILTGRRLT